MISAFVFAIRIVQSLFYLNPTFQASSHLLWLYSPVCVGPGRKPRRPYLTTRLTFIGLIVMTLLKVNLDVSSKTHNSIPIFINLHITCLSVSTLILQELVREHTHMAVDYQKELEDWISHDYYDENVHKIQLPFANVSASPYFPLSFLTKPPPPTHTQPTLPHHTTTNTYTYGEL